MPNRSSDPIKNHASFIWSVADLLRGDDKQSEYGRSSCRQIADIVHLYGNFDAAALVDWEFFTTDGNDICRVSIDPSDHPVLEKKGDTETFWWRTPVSTDKIDNDQERDRVIARRWSSS